eukprot:Gb_23666 [translate_table: standard]
MGAICVFNKPSPKTGRHTIVVALAILCSGHDAVRISMIGPRLMLPSFLGCRGTCIVVFSMRIETLAPILPFHMVIPNVEQGGMGFRSEIGAHLLTLIKGYWEIPLFPTRSEKTNDDLVEEGGGGGRRTCYNTKKEFTLSREILKPTMAIIDNLFSFSSLPERVDEMKDIFLPTISSPGVRTEAITSPSSGSYLGLPRIALARIYWRKETLRLVESVEHNKLRPKVDQGLKDGACKVYCALVGTYYYGSKRGQAVIIERLSLSIPRHTGREVKWQGHTLMGFLAEYSSHPNI